VSQANQGDSRDGPAPGGQPSPDEVFNRFFRAAFPGLVAFGYGCCANWADAEDAATEAMIGVLQRWSAIGEGKHETYARVAMVRAIVKIRRPRAGFQTYPAPIHELPVLPDSGRELTALEDSEWISQLLDRLPPAQRAVVEGFLAGKTYREMAVEQRKSEPTIRKNQQLGLKALGRFLTRNEGLVRPSGPAMTTREGNR
jgi:RNA polymerase sigma factor (sigma-70 family)